METPPTNGAVDKAVHAGLAAQFALVAAAVLTIVGLGLGFFSAHAPTQAQQVIVAVLLWPAFLINTSTMTATLIVCFILQFALLWLLAFAVLRYRMRGGANAL